MMLSSKRRGRAGWFALLLTLVSWGQTPPPATDPAVPPFPTQAPTPPPPPALGGLNARGLAEFGPVGTPAQALDSYRKALTEMSNAGGGLLFVPETVPMGISLENTVRWSHSIKPESNDLRDWKMGPGVMVLDARGGSYKLVVPQLSDKTSSAGLTLSRTLRLPPGDSLQHWTREAVVAIDNTIVHGSCNYLDWITADVEPGPDARFYVPLAHNLFKGMYLNAHGEKGYGGVVERITVKDIGWDPEKKSYYFTAQANSPHKAGAIVQNKSHTPAMHVMSRMNASNQTFDVYVERAQYGNGDSYMFDAIFGYMGNVHSMAGDENGACYVAYIKSLTNIYRGTVKSFSAATGDLVFSGGAAVTLGQARPMINLNPAKWVTAGTVMIVPAESWWDTVDTGKYPFEGKTYPTGVAPARGSGNRGLRMGGLIRGSVECPWDDSLIGRFFAVDVPAEYVPKTDKVRRWYEITGVTVLPDGRKDLLIQRLWWGAKDAGAPTLYSPESYSYDGHLRALKYIIAPGAMVADLSRWRGPHHSWPSQWSPLARRRGQRQSSRRAGPAA